MTKHRRLVLLASAAVVLVAAPLAAGPLAPPVPTMLPQGGSVQGGSATVSSQGSNLIINQATNSAIINWNTFNIGSAGSVKINQPGANSVQLDRVTGGLGPSQIFGTLVSNGIVFLVNPNGILFGQGAQINVGGLLATTHDIKNSDFMAGNYSFNGSGNSHASIVNAGSITATSGGFAALVAPGVRNSGTITATLGTVGLTAGNGFTLDMYGDKLITLAVGESIAKQVVDVATMQPLSSLVTNTGKLSANGGKVQITAAAAKAVLDSVINTSGTIEANTVGTKNGMIVLNAATGASKPKGAPAQNVVVAGKLSAAGKGKGTTGGTIAITGENISVTGAKIDASGNAGGGTVLIGGDVGGGKGNAAVSSIPQAALQPYTVPTATTVSIDAGTVINASATGTGNGGTVVIWSDQLTAFAGLVNATGGPQGGNGGFAEVSSHGVLSFTGLVNLGAPAGAAGTLLLDPQDLFINTTGTPPGGEPTASAISVATLQNELGMGNVVLTTGPVASSQAGNITVQNSVAWSTGFSLTLSAYDNVIVNASLTNTGGANIVLRADNTGTGVGTVTFGSSRDQVSTSGRVTIFYNPSDNPVNSVVNTTSYTSPTDYSVNVTAGTLNAYMLVNTVYDLQNIQNNLIADFALGRTINASATAEETANGGAGFVPIGENNGGFAGRFNGDGYTISGLTIVSAGTSSTLGLGLFSDIDQAPLSKSQSRPT